MDTMPLQQSTHWTGADASSDWIETAREVAKNLRQHATEKDRSGEFVHEAFAQLKADRFMSMLVPAALGGGGASHAEAGAALAELAHGCPSTSLALSMHLHLVAAQVWRYHRDLPAPVLGKVAASELVLVSTGASDWLASNGKVAQVDGGYRVSARKTPASASPAGGAVVTTARWDDAPGGAQVLHMAIPFDAPGVSIEETWDSMGMRATGSHTVVLNDVFVADDAIVLARPADVWHPVWSAVVGAAMPLIMSTYVGVAEAAVDEAIKLARLRSDSTGDTTPLVGRMLTRLTSARDTVRTMFDASANLSFDNTIEFASTTLARKTTSTEAVLDTVRLALEVGGGQAYGRASSIERLYRDAHGALYHPLPRAKQERFTGEIALGE